MRRKWPIHRGLPPNSVVSTFRKWWSLMPLIWTIWKIHNRWIWKNLSKKFQKKSRRKTIRSVIRSSSICYRWWRSRMTIRSSMWIFLTNQWEGLFLRAKTKQKEVRRIWIQSYWKNSFNYWKIKMGLIKNRRINICSR